MLKVRRDHDALWVSRPSFCQLDSASTLCSAVAKFLEDADLELLKFYVNAIWKSLRTINTLDNLNREFRRRTKTQASFGTEDAALIVLYGLVAVGQIQLRKIDGYNQLPAFIAKEWQKVA